MHLAALSNDPLGDLDPELTYDINLRGTLHLAERAREAGVERFVFASSCSMYGAASGDDLLDESAPLRPLTPYAESKVKAEAGLSAAGRTTRSRRSHCATRPPTGSRRASGSTSSSTTSPAGRSRPGRIRLLSDGSAWRPIVHVADIGRATLGALERTARAWCTTSPSTSAPDAENYRVRELAEFVHEAAARTARSSIAGASYADPRSYRVDFGRFQELLPDHTPTWTARKGAGELVEAYGEVGLSPEEFEGYRYTRLKQIRRLLDGGLLDGGLRWTRAGR